MLDLLLDGLTGWFAAGLSRGCLLAMIALALVIVAAAIWFSM